MKNGWCLVLVLWGDKYCASHINAIVTSTFHYSATCAEIILMTDSFRAGVDQRVRQVLIADDLNRPEFKNDYTIKLSMFDPRALPPHTPCVYLDLDTVVTGDLGRMASLARGPEDMYMLPPGNLLSFGIIRRVAFLLTRGRSMATGNSSIVVFHSNMMPNLLLEFKRLKHQGGVPARFLSNDDIFISWFGQRRLKAVPTDLGVMFRREFLSRSKWLGWLSSRLPWVIQRREKIVAVTFNGFENKLEKLIQLPDGTLHQDSKGRFGYWSCKEMGPIKDRIVQAVERHSQLL